MKRIEGIYFHAWHFVYAQVQLTNWVGNIVAGVVTFLVLTIVWPKFRHVVERAVGVSKLHEKLDQQHRERMEQASKHHQAAVLLAKSHHAAHLKALADATKPVAPAPRKATAPVKKATPTPRKAAK